MPNLTGVIAKVAWGVPTTMSSRVRRWVEVIIRARPKSLSTLLPSRVIRMFEGSPATFLEDEFTSASWLSHFARKGKRELFADDLIRQARHKIMLTPDLGGRATTRQVGDAVLAHLGDSA